LRALAKQSSFAAAKKLGQWDNGVRLELQDLAGEQACFSWVIERRTVGQAHQRLRLIPGSKIPLFYSINSGREFNSQNAFFG